MIKTIKFDLKLSNSTAIRTLDDLEENLSPALFEHFHSGKLAKWLRVRKLDELADKMEALQTEYLEDKNELDVQLFKKLCEVFVSEVDLEDAREAVAEFKSLPVVEIEDIEEVEESKSLMVIEQPQTKEFHLNERLLYKTFMELGGEIKDDDNKNRGRINYAKGETRPSKTLVELLKKYSINIDDVVICYGGVEHCCILTNRHLIFLGHYLKTSEHSTETHECRLKILLDDIYYFDCASIYYKATAVVNNHIFACDGGRFFIMYQFVKNYLALEPIKDKFERIYAK